MAANKSVFLHSRILYFRRSREHTRKVKYRYIVKWMIRSVRSY